MLFQLFVSVILTAWAWFATVFLGSYLGFFLFVAPGSTSGAKNLVFPFLTRTKCEPMSDGYNYMSLSMTSNAYITFCSHIFILFLSLALHTKRLSLLPWQCWFILKNLPSIRAYFNYVFEVFQGLFIAFLL